LVNLNIQVSTEDVEVDFDNVALSANAVVPIPTALPLLLSGLFGLGAMGWRRRKAA
jgi:hypothetical protein